MSAPVERRAATAIALSLSSLPFLVPHVIEDFHLGIASRVGLTPTAGATLLGAGLALQMLGLVLAARGARAGLVLTAAAGAVWAAGGLWGHGPELLARGLAFRDSALSAAAATGLVAGQALAAAFALAALWRGVRS